MSDINPQVDPELAEEIAFEEAKIEEIEKQFETQTLLDRIKLLLKGLKAPAGSREYKEALIELQRLLAPVGAVVIPLIFIAILFVCSVPNKSNRDLRDINVAKAEDDATLDEPPPDMEDTQEQNTDQTVETEVMNDIANPSLDNIATPTDVVSPSTDTTAPTVDAPNAVMDIVAPVKMRTSLQASRSAGARAKSLAKFGGDAETERCVMRALRWLKTQQRPDGSWAGHSGSLNMTGFVVLTYLSRGIKPGGDPEFGETLRKGVEFLMKNRHKDAIALAALAEAYGLSRNPNIREIVEQSLNDLADKMKETIWGPHRDGSKAVEPRDLTKLTFYVMALRSAQLSKFKIPNLQKGLDKLREGFLHQANKKYGGFSSAYYGPPPINYPRIMMWHYMLGVVGMQYVGAGDNPVIDKTLGILMDEWEPPTLTTTDISCCPVRANYWATMVFFNYFEGDKRWAEYNQKMKTCYKRGQHKETGKYLDHRGMPQEIGYWTCEDMHIGTQPIAPTCYVALQLMVYYRYLPTGQKNAWKVTEEKEEKVTGAAKDDVDVSIDI
jgi:cytoskeletal protein RodZ